MPSITITNMESIPTTINVEYENIKNKTVNDKTKDAYTKMHMKLTPVETSNKNTEKLNITESILQTFPDNKISKNNVVSKNQTDNNSTLNNNNSVTEVTNNKQYQSIEIVNENEVKDEVEENKGGGKVVEKKKFNSVNSVVVDVDPISSNNNSTSSPPVQILETPPPSTLIKSKTDRKSSPIVLARNASVTVRGQRIFVHAFLLIMLFVSLLVALVSLVWLFLGPLVASLLLVVVGITYLIASGSYRWFYVAFKTLPRDSKAVFRFIRLKILIYGFEKRNVNIGDLLREKATKHPDKVCFIYEDQKWTFGQVEEYSNKIANIFKSHGYKKGDAVALFMENKPEFICIWLGLSKLGVITPLINTNLRQTSLLHSFNIGKSQAIIFGSELSGAVKDIFGKLDSTVALYVLNASNSTQNGELKARNLNTLLSEAPATVPVVNEKIGYHDRLVYIYTSGTTGLPKAAVITHARFVFIAGGIHYVAPFSDDDIIYTPLPLYHTAGGCMSVGQALLFGNTVVIRKKFSASSYFTDCRKYNCTVAQYIGEMCRYILAVPTKPEDKNHKVRTIFGNGLRPQIWKEFTERFNIPYVTEFYGATEGNANIVNVDNKLGAIGFISRILPAVYPISIIRVDESGEPLRGEDGLCMTCKPNEPGVFIGKIIESDPSRAFLGYVDEKASEKKIVRDVFKKGDQAFLSGDILVSDEFGYLFFKDRTGDTFRWKGENVSTSEVEAVVSNLINYKDAVVYGVEINGQEGRAGMTAIYDPDSTLDLVSLANGVKKELPTYARPQIVRILNKLDLTGTYKLKKVDLQKEGFDPNSIKDKLYYMNSSGSYELLTPEIYNQINNGKIRL